MEQIICKVVIIEKLQTFHKILPNYSIRLRLTHHNIGKNFLIKTILQQGPASSDGKACVSEIFASTGTSMGSGSNPTSARIFSIGIEMYSINTGLRVFEICDGIWTHLNIQKSKSVYSMGERSNLNKYDPASIFQVKQSCHTERWHSCGWQCPTDIRCVRNREHGRKKDYFAILSQAGVLNLQLKTKT